MVLPEPFGPSRPKISPDSTSNQTSATATVRPYSLRRPLASTTAAMASSLGPETPPCPQPTVTGSAADHGKTLTKSCLQEDLTTLLRRAGRSEHARAAYDKASELAGNTAEIAYLTRRRDQLGWHPSRIRGSVPWRRPSRW